MTNQKQKEFEVPADVKITIETTSGSIKVAGWDRGQVVITGGDTAVTESENGLTIRSQQGGSEDVAVQVPQGAALEIRSMSGSIDVRDVSGAIGAKSMSGDLRVDSTSSVLRLRAVSGELRATAGRASVLQLESVSGGIEIDAALQPAGEYALRSVSGDVLLRVPEDQRCTFDFSSISGSVKCKLPHEQSKRGWGKATVTVNGGGAEVEVRTVSGSLRVKASDSAESGAEDDDRPPTHAAAAPAPAAEPRDTRPLDADDAPFGLDTESEPFAAEPASANVGTRRMEILKAIETGAISVSDGLAKLRELG